MTMPDERTRSLLQTRDFLEELCSSGQTPGVPEEVRREARRLLRHYPMNMHLNLLHKALPRWFDPLPPASPVAADIVDLLGSDEHEEPPRPTLDDPLEERRSGRPYEGPDSR